MRGFATELAIAKDRANNSQENLLVRMFDDALAIYEASYKYWGDAIKKGSAAVPQTLWTAARGDGLLESPMKLYLQGIVSEKDAERAGGARSVLVDILGPAPKLPTSPAAIAKLKRDAQAGQAEAQCQLGIHYNGGDGVPKDYAQGVFWLRKAADQGDAFAQLNLSHSYAAGEGVPENRVEAHKWGIIAAARAPAQQRTKYEETRDLILPFLTAAQILEAQKKAQDWLDGFGSGPDGQRRSSQSPR